MDYKSRQCCVKTDQAYISTWDGGFVTVFFSVREEELQLAKALSMSQAETDGLYPSTSEELFAEKKKQERKKM